MGDYREKGFPKIRGAFLGVPMIRVTTFLGLIGVPPSLSLSATQFPANAALTDKFRVGVPLFWQTTTSHDHSWG